MIWIFIVVVVLIVLCVCQHSSQSEIEFEPQPCVTDEEFCELMPEISPDIALRVRAVIADSTGWDREEIHPGTKIIEFELW